MASGKMNIGHKINNMNSIQKTINLIEEEMAKGTMTFDQEQGAYQAWLDLHKELRYKDN